MSEDVFDCVVIGGGPAGLTAAIYLARFRRLVAVFDSGQSRAALIPRTRNYPGFAHGIAGADLLSALREQAQKYGVTLLACEATDLEQGPEFFQVKGDCRQVEALYAIMATGLRDIRPRIDDLEDDEEGSLVRYCPVCDGYEATDRNICVYGRAEDAGGKALFMRSFSRSVTLLSADGECPDKTSSELEAAGVSMPRHRVTSLRQEGDKLAAKLEDGSELRFDIMYPVLGCHVRSSLATRLGAKHTDIGCLVVDEHGQTTVPGLYAVGDVVSDLHQIAVATGHAAVAATHIHNRLPRNFR